MMLPIIKRLSAVHITAFAAAVLAASGAQAQPYHYWGVLVTENIPSDANSGAQITIDTEILDNSTCSNFENHEFWYGTDSSFTYWIEVGFKQGWTGTGNVGTCVNGSGPGGAGDFWCDDRPVDNGGGHCHFPNNGWSFNTWYNALIQTTGSCTWAVWLGGVNIGTSTSNCPGSGRRLQAGIENYINVPSDGCFAKGFLTDFAEEESPQGGNWLFTWDGAFTSASSGSEGQPPPPAIHFTNPPTDTETEEVLNESF
jgi:hypothetical protein